MNKKTPSPKNSDSRFDYQFYFMFRTYRQKEGEYIEEPEDFPPIEQLPDTPNPQQVIGYKIDNDDKRLFRFHLADRPALTEGEWNQHLADYWKSVRHEYDNCLVRDNQTGQVSTRNASEELLFGVALLIIGDQLTEQTITIPLRDDQGEAKGHQLFTPAKSTTLFSLQDTEQKMTEVMRFIEFGNEYDQRFPERRKVSHWQLQLGQDSFLKPIQAEEHDNHPFMVVYGLERGKNLPGDIREKADNFLLFGKGDKGHTVFLELLPKLLMRHWQFNHIDAAASQFQQQLDARNALYRSYSSQRLDCAATHRLQQELHQMKTLGAEGKYMLGRLQGAVKTLEINAKDLTDRLSEIIQPLAQERGWQIVFDPALEKDYFDSSLDVLQNRLSYLHSALTHLEGSSNRWQAMLEERRLELTENIGTIAHLIVFLVALVEMGKLAHENLETFAWLHGLDTTWPIEILTKFLVSPTVYVVLIVWFLRKDVWKWMTRKCRCGKLCQWWFNNHRGDLK